MRATGLSWTRRASPGGRPGTAGRSTGRFSVDNTSSWFATAVLSSRRTARAKETVEERLAALRALVGIADLEYFDEQLEWAAGSGPVDRVAADVEDVVRRGVRRLLDGDAPAFDLPTQLVDLTAALVESDDDEVRRRVAGALELRGSQPDSGSG